MKTLNELIPMEKDCKIHLACTDFISDYIGDENNVRIRILKSTIDGRYFYHEMKNGYVVKCFEIALDRAPFTGVYVFAYTPDGMHICTIDSRQPHKVEYRRLKENQVQDGMEFIYKGITFKILNDNAVSIGNKAIVVKEDNNSVFKLLKSSIKAIGGARGLFSFLENECINSNGNYNAYLNQFLEMYYK